MEGYDGLASKHLLLPSASWVRAANTHHRDCLSSGSTVDNLLAPLAMNAPMWAIMDVSPHNNAFPNSQFRSINHCSASRHDEPWVNFCRGGCFVGHRLWAGHSCCPPSNELVLPPSLQASLSTEKPRHPTPQTLPETSERLASRRCTLVSPSTNSFSKTTRWASWAASRFGSQFDLN